MNIQLSRPGFVLALLYGAVALYVAINAYKCQGSGFVRCDIAIVLITLPAAWLFYGVLKVPEYNFVRPGAGDIVQVMLLIFLCAGLMYGLGYGLERLYRLVSGAKARRTPD